MHCIRLINDNVCECINRTMHVHACLLWLSPLCARLMQIQVSSLALCVFSFAVQRQIVMLQREVRVTQMMCLVVMKSDNLPSSLYK